MTTEAPRRRRWRVLLVVALAVAGVWLGATALWAHLDWWLLETAAAEHRILEDSFTSLAMVVRDEVLLAAPAPGRVHRLVSDGSRVRAQAAVASVETAGGALLARA